MNQSIVEKFFGTLNRCLVDPVLDNLHHKKIVIRFLSAVFLVPCVSIASLLFLIIGGILCLASFVYLIFTGKIL